MSGSPGRAIAVLGLGGVGGMVAARTAALCVGTERTVTAIRAAGLRLVHEGETTVARPEAVERLERPVELLVVAVKAYDLETALERIAPEAVAGAVVLPLLNGLEHVDTIRGRFEACDPVSQALPTVVAGSIGGVEVFSPEPGVVVQRTAGATITAASRELGGGRLAAALASLQVPGIEVVVAADERTVLWEKAARLAAIAAAAVVSGCPVGVLRQDDAWRDRLRSALEEACLVARAEGTELDPAGQWAIIESLPADLIPSAARDAAARGPTELDAITGAVVRAGVRAGVPTPQLEQLLDEAHARASA